MTHEKFRKLLLDWRAIEGDGGPGTQRDRRGAWHLFCHLAAAGALFRITSGGSAWVGVLFNRDTNRYFAAVCTDINGRQSVLRLQSLAARELLASGQCCAYLEGASRGHILDRSANDAGDPNTDDRRQDYDQRIDSSKDGGPVWEMWTVSRDIRPISPLGTSVVQAYGELLEVLGGKFAAIVARGRMEPEYGHMRQMCAMIDAGFITKNDALSDIDAIAIPHHVEQRLMNATPQAFATSARLLLRKQRPLCYFMYGRKLSSFAPASLLRRMVTTLGPAVHKHA